MKKILLSLVAGFFLQGLAGASAYAVDVIDMILVPRVNQPFLIDIFEATNREASKAIGIADWGNISWKPARMDYDQAKAYCKVIKKRLPTLREWKAAASNDSILLQALP